VSDEPSHPLAHDLHLFLHEREVNLLIDRQPFALQNCVSGICPECLNIKRPIRALPTDSSKLRRKDRQKKELDPRICLLEVEPAQATVS